MNTATLEKRSPVISRVREQKWLETALGERFSVRIRSTDVAGAYTIIEAIFPPRVSPPLHIHLHEDEVFQILEGQLHFICEGEEFDAGAGEFVVIPKGHAHTWKNNSDQPARVLGLLTPGGAEVMFEAVANASVDQIEAIMRPYGCVFVGPSL